MKSVSMSGSLRENVGKKDAKMLRKQGLVPAVIYGGTEQHFFSIPEKELMKAVNTPEVFFIELNIGGMSKKATIQEIQFHPVKDTPVHVDFLEIVEGKPITIDLPVLITGTSPGVLRGGKLHKKSRKLRVCALLEHMPENITVDISKLNIGDAIRVKDVTIEHLTLLDIPTNIVVAVRTARGVSDDEAEESEEGEGEEGAPAATEEA